MSQYKQWDIQVFNKRTNTYHNDSAGKAVVMNSAQTLVTASTLVTTVADQQGTAQTQPITLSAGRLTFYTAKTVTTVDISILLANGHAIYARGLTSSVHRLDIYPEKREQMFVYPLLFLAAGTAVDTGFDLPIGCLIRDAIVRVLAVDSGETVDLGFINAVESGDEDGLRALVSVASLGFVQDTAVITGGANIDYTPVTTYGVLLRTSITGSDAVATNGGSTPIKYLTDGTIKSLSYTPSAGDTFKGLAYLFYDLLDG